jgi:predicted Fe-Mo cluster-binding NifX family protein
MKIVITSMGSEIDSPFSPAFGRCPAFIFLDEDAKEVEAIENPAANAPGGAGIQAAKFVIDHGAQVVITGRVGPNAMDVLKTTDVKIYLFSGDTVRSALDAHNAGQLQQASTAAGGMGGRGRGRGRGRRRA